MCIDLLSERISLSLKASIRIWYELLCLNLLGARTGQVAMKDSAGLVAFGEWRLDNHRRTHQRPSWGKVDAAKALK
jgi:hypothetical protein